MHAYSLLEASILSRYIPLKFGADTYMHPPPVMSSALEDSHHVSIFNNRSTFGAGNRRSVSHLSGGHRKEVCFRGRALRSERRAISQERHAGRCDEPTEPRIARLYRCTRPFAKSTHVAQTTDSEHPAVMQAARLVDIFDSNPANMFFSFNMFTRHLSK